MVIVLQKQLNFFGGVEIIDSAVALSVFNIYAIIRKFIKK